MEIISGYSKLSKDAKINWLIKNSHLLSQQFKEDLNHSQYPSIEAQKKFEQFSENTIGNFHIPFGIAPNFVINNKNYAVPMVIEESSVVAAASKAAKFWSTRGGFQTQVLSKTKRGHIYFEWKKTQSELAQFLEDHKDILLNSTLDLNQNMEKRGGGIQNLILKPLINNLKNVYALELQVNTCDAMGANYINSLLERIDHKFSELLSHENEPSYSPIMAILSNSTPECIVEVKVQCPIKAMGTIDGLSSKEFVDKFKKAVDIAYYDPCRAVTHNKGIMNGVDAVILATGNDFRAIEASCHSYAARDGQYRSLSTVEISDDEFKFSMKLPLAVGTVGGLTKLHNLAMHSLDLLGGPNASELMGITASVGLAQNFGALRSLVTTGIQKGHMKMHLMNILNQLKATKNQEEAALTYFKDKVVSYRAVREFLDS